jgi:hypothetical protein
VEFSFATALGGKNVRVIHSRFDPCGVPDRWYRPHLLVAEIIVQKRIYKWVRRVESCASQPARRTTMQSSKYASKVFRNSVVSEFFPTARFLQQIGFAEKLGDLRNF